MSSSTVVDTTTSFSNRLNEREKKWLNYDGWLVYSGTTTGKEAKWSYKKGTFEMQPAFFFRNMKYAKGKKHTAVFILSSSTPTLKQWRQMDAYVEKTKNNKTSQPIKICDFRHETVKGKRQNIRPPAVQCLTCSNSNRHVSFKDGYCPTCSIKQVREIQRARKRKKVLEAERAAELSSYVEEIKRLNASIGSLEVALKRITVEAQRKTSHIDDIQRALTTLTLERNNSIKLLQQQSDKNKMLVEETIDNDKMHNNIIEIILDAESSRDNLVEGIKKDFFQKKNELKDVALQLEKTQKEMQKKLKILASEFRNFTLTDSSIFSTSIFEDVYLAIYNCSSTSRSQSQTGLERQGNIGVYNGTLMNIINEIIGMEIPLVADRNQSSGTVLTIPTLNRLHHLRNWYFASRDIVFKKNSDSNYSLRKHRHLLIPLLEAYYKEVASPKYDKTVLDEMDAKEYQILFLQLYRWHFKKGVCQQRDDMKSDTSFDYSKYNFMINDGGFRISHTKVSHGVRNEANPHHVSLWLYCYTYTYVWNEPCLGMASSGRSRRTDERTMSHINNMMWEDLE
jgi:hypothetical protein